MATSHLTPEKLLGSNVLPPEWAAAQVAFVCVTPFPNGLKKYVEEPAQERYFLHTPNSEVCCFAYEGITDLHCGDSKPLWEPPRLKNSYITASGISSPLVTLERSTVPQWGNPLLRQTQCQTSHWRHTMGYVSMCDVGQPMSFMSL